MLCPSHRQTTIHHEYAAPLFFFFLTINSFASSLEFRKVFEKPKRYSGMLNSIPSCSPNTFSSNNVIALPLVILSIFIIVTLKYLKGPENHFSYEDFLVGEKELLKSILIVHLLFFALLWQLQNQGWPWTRKGVKIGKSKERVENEGKILLCSFALEKGVLELLFKTKTKNINLEVPLFILLCKGVPVEEKVKSWKLKCRCLLDKMGCTECS